MVSLNVKDIAKVESYVIKVNRSVLEKLNDSQNIEPDDLVALVDTVKRLILMVRCTYQDSEINLTESRHNLISLCCSTLLDVVCLQQQKNYSQSSHEIRDCANVCFYYLENQLEFVCDVVLYAEKITASNGAVPKIFIRRVNELIMANDVDISTKCLLKLIVLRCKMNHIFGSFKGEHTLDQFFAARKRKPVKKWLKSNGFGDVQSFASLDVLSRSIDTALGERILDTLAGAKHADVSAVSHNDVPQSCIDSAVCTESSNHITDTANAFGVIDAAIIDTDPILANGDDAQPDSVSMEPSPVSETQKLLSSSKENTYKNLIDEEKQRPLVTDGAFIEDAILADNDEQSDTVSTEHLVVSPTKSPIAAVRVSISDASPILTVVEAEADVVSSTEPISEKNNNVLGSENLNEALGVKDDHSEADALSVTSTEVFKVDEEVMNSLDDERSAYTTTEQMISPVTGNRNEQQNMVFPVADNCTTTTMDEPAIGDQVCLEIETGPDNVKETVKDQVCTGIETGHGEFKEKESYQDELVEQPMEGVAQETSCDKNETVSTAKYLSPKAGAESHISSRLRQARKVNLERRLEVSIEPLSTETDTIDDNQVKNFISEKEKLTNEQPIKELRLDLEPLSPVIVKSCQIPKEERVSENPYEFRDCENECQASKASSTKEISVVLREPKVENKRPTRSVVTGKVNGGKDDETDSKLQSSIITYLRNRKTHVRGVLISTPKRRQSSQTTTPRSSKHVKQSSVKENLFFTESPGTANVENTPSAMNLRNKKVSILNREENLAEICQKTPKRNSTALVENRFTATKQRNAQTTPKCAKSAKDNEPESAVSNQTPRYVTRSRAKEQQQ